MLPSAIIFDAFGTLLDITHRTHPYRTLLREGAGQGRVPCAEDLRALMTWNCSITEAADRLSIRLSAARGAAIQAALDEELASLVPYPDGLDAVAMLHAAGVRIGICSNLTAPYGASVKEHYPAVDAFAFSYEVGALKPEPPIYEAMCNSLGVGAERDSRQVVSTVVMIGDWPKCDRDGPGCIGISGFLLTRGGGEIENLLQFATMILHPQAL